jgi:hypothetical protein
MEFSVLSAAIYYDEPSGHPDPVKSERGAERSVGAPMTIRYQGQLSYSTVAAHTISHRQLLDSPETAPQVLPYICCTHRIISPYHMLKQRECAVRRDKREV